MKNIKKNFITSGIFIIIFTSILLTDVLIKEVNIIVEEKNNKKSSNERIYNEYGLLDNQQLSNTLIYENIDYKIYDDRILKKFTFVEENIDNAKTMFSNLKEITNREIYLMPIPERIIFEDNNQIYKEYYKEFFNKLEILIGNNINLVDVSNNLRNHKNEYIYFRTDDSWTSRGAYYGVEAFYEKLNIKDYMKLNEYEEHQYREFLGDNALDYINKYKHMEDRITLLPQDPSYYYLNPTYNGRVIRSIKDNNKVLNEGLNLVSKVRLGKSSVIGNNYFYAMVEGQKKDSEELMIICDNTGQTVIPYLVEQYSKIHVIKVMEYDYNEIEFSKILEESKIKHVLIAQKAIDIGDLSKNRFFINITNN